jgi:putative PIG3 family NAD(P)H quinone oxidoreductase
MRSERGAQLNDLPYAQAVRAVVITRPGGPEVLEVQEVPDPVAGAGEVLIDVVATAINRADLLQRAGNYPPPAGASPYPGMECSGRIAALGPGATGWQVGDEVCALLAGGGYAEQVAVPVGQVLPRPSAVSLVDSAGLPETSCTVHSMVFTAGRLAAGESVLIHGGTSGIGTMAIQLAHRRGATVFTTAGTPRKVGICRDLGADVAINYREEDFAERISAETMRSGVDVILDNMGAKYLPRNVSSLAIGGRLIVIGLQGGIEGELNLATLMARRASVFAAGLRGRPAEEKAAIVAAARAFVWPQLDDGSVVPVIDRVLSLEDAPEAHQLMESSEHIGKVLLRVR